MPPTGTRRNTLFQRLKSLAIDALEEQVIAAFEFATTRWRSLSIPDGTKKIYADAVMVYNADGSGGAFKNELIAFYLKVLELEYDHFVNCYHALKTKIDSFGAIDDYRSTRITQFLSPFAQYLDGDLVFFESNRSRAGELCFEATKEIDKILVQQNQDNLRREEERLRRWQTQRNELTARNLKRIGYAPQQTQTA